MPITIPKQTEKDLLKSIKRFSAEHLDGEFGDLKAALLLEFCLKEIGPTVYNQAIADAQAYLQEKAEDLPGVRHQPEFAYWQS
ncbi:MAG TPA: DUF2164 domain-containing protein [Candidatus Thermoplasmatota archaeon]|nr:DUF2164 domain-containing protein [Candidatus Thermoplasmatota archaeon]